MLKIVVVDLSAESRNRIVSQLSSFLSEDVQNSEFLPRVSINPLSLQELKYHEAPDLCIIGDQLVKQELLQVGAIRNLLPEAALLVRTTDDLESLAIIEQLARMGVNDTFTEQTSPAEFIKKVVLHARRIAKKRSGQLVVVGSGKGGTGVTSIVAGLAEAAIEHGKRVAVIDFDFATQDLSRFIQARPYLNENLRLLCDGQRPVTQEFVEQCLVRVWQDCELFCMPPLVESDDLYNLEAKHARTFVSIIEILDSKFDLVLVDCAGVRGALWRTIHRLADRALVVVNNDPAAMYASVDHVAKVRSNLSVGAKLVMLENAAARGGLSKSALRSEFNRAAMIEDANWIDAAIPYQKDAGRWPASGATMHSLGQESGRRVLVRALHQLGVIETPLLATNERAGWLKRLAKGRAIEAMPAISNSVKEQRAIANLSVIPEENLITPAQISYVEADTQPQAIVTKAESLSTAKGNLVEGALISGATIL
jgi:MinD-like ATPase involved in chromosome partitioning or flagellar assembly